MFLLKKKFKDLHGTTSSQHSYVLVIPITIQLQPINQGGEGELLTSNKKKGGEKGSPLQTKFKNTKKPFRVIANTTVLYWHSISCNLINADTGSAEK